MSVPAAAGSNSDAKPTMREQIKALLRGSGDREEPPEADAPDASRGD